VIARRVERAQQILRKDDEISLAEVALRVGFSDQSRDDMSVVDGTLKVYGIEGLRVADGSIMPRVVSGNTMAPCAIIGERAPEILRTEYDL
jgi:choline dehydrogenase